MASPKSSTRAMTTRSSATILRLVPSEKPPLDKHCVETAKALSLLLQEAVAGRLSGFSYVAMNPGRGYIADAVGECESNPTFTRGMVRALDDKLARMVIR